MIKSVMHVMSGEGDQEITWDPDDAESKAKARGKIEALQKEGYRFYISGDREDDVSTIVDKRVEQVVAVAPMAGG